MWKECGWSNSCWAYLHSKCRHLTLTAQTHFWDWKYCKKVVRILTALQYDILPLYSRKTDCVVYDLIKKHQLPPRKPISKKHISFSYYKQTRWYRWCSYRIMHDIHCISNLPVCFRPMLIATSLTLFKHLAVKGPLSLNHRKMCSVPLDALNRLFRYLRKNISIT